MLSTVDLNDQLCLETNEVNDEPTNRLLPLEFETV
jgi:hypothetical protein